MATAILAIQLEFLVSGNLEADEVGLKSPWSILDLLYGRFHGGELDQAEEGRVKGFIILVESIDLTTMFEETEQFISDDAEDGEEDEQNDQNIQSMRKNHQQSVDHLVSERNLIKYWVNR